MGSDLRTNRAGEPYIIGPTGAPLTLNDLPPAETRRWVPRRKAEVVAAVHGALITREEALRRYSLSEDELQAWERSVERGGIAGLRVTKIQQYRGGHAHG